ncbi:TPA: hypothetical protein ACXE9F_003954, partial [Pluralibacter gergoviae]
NYPYSGCLYLLYPVYFRREPIAVIGNPSAFSGSAVSVISEICKLLRNPGSGLLFFAANLRIINSLRFYRSIAHTLHNRVWCKQLKIQARVMAGLKY